MEMQIMSGSQLLARLLLLLLLVPKLRLGTPLCETLFRVRVGTRNRVSRRAFPNRAWERGQGGKQTGPSASRQWALLRRQHAHFEPRRLLPVPVHALRRLDEILGIRQEDVRHVFLRVAIH